MVFKGSSADHMVAHSKGGKTSDLSSAQLLHERCHRKVEEERAKENGKFKQRNKIAHGERRVDR